MSSKGAVPVLVRNDPTALHELNDYECDEFRILCCVSPLFRFLSLSLFPCSAEVVCYSYIVSKHSTFRLGWTIDMWMILLPFLFLSVRIPVMKKKTEKLHLKQTYIWTVDLIQSNPIQSNPVQSTSILSHESFAGDQGTGTSITFLIQ